MSGFKRFSDNFSSVDLKSLKGKELWLFPWDFSVLTNQMHFILFPNGDFSMWYLTCVVFIDPDAFLWKDSWFTSDLQASDLPASRLQVSSLKTIVLMPIVHKPLVHKPVVHKPVVLKPVLTMMEFNNCIPKLENARTISVRQDNGGNGDWWFVGWFR